MVVLNIFIRLKLFIVTIKKREYVVVQPSSNYMGSICMPHLFNMKMLSQPVLAFGPLKPVLSVVFNCKLQAHNILFVFASGKTMNSLDLSKKKRQKEIELWPIAFLLHVDLHNM